MARRFKGALADQLQALMAYRNRKDHEPEPVKSSFASQPANENRATAKSEGLSSEKLLRTTPSIEEMRRQWTNNEPERDDKGRIVAIGSLRFSTGWQTERAYRRVLDGTVEQYDREMPKGAMLGTKEQLTEDAGGQGVAVTISNSEFCRRMGLPDREYIPSGRRRRGRSYTTQQSKDLLAEAVANTKTMPPVKRYPPGIASGTAQYSDQFIGGKIGSTGRGGSIQWYDVHAARERQAEERKAFEEISLSDKRVLEAALTSGTLADVGVAAGQSAQYADKRSGGRRALLAANDNCSPSAPLAQI